MERKRIAEATKGVGKPKVGGPFELIDHDGQSFTSEDMKGKYALVGPSPSVQGGSIHAPPKKLRADDVYLRTGLLRLHALPRHLS